MFDDLKEIGGGVHSGAGPTNLRLPNKPIAHPLAPVQRSAASHPLAPVQRPAPAPAPAPMPKLAATPTPSSPPPANAAPSHSFKLPKSTAPIASMLGLKPQASLPSRASAAPLKIEHLAATSPALASIAAAAGIVASSPSSSSSSSSSSLASMLATHGAATAPSSGGLVDRAPHTSRTDTQKSIAGAGSEARGFGRVERSARPKHAQGMPPSETNDTRGGTLKGRSIMGYKGTGEITYCPINSAGNVAANSQATLPGVRPSKPFQGQRLLIDPSLWAVFTIVDIKLGNEPVAVTAGAVSAGNFPPANGPKFEWRVADGVDIIFTVANVTATATPFSALILGEVCTQG